MMILDPSLARSVCRGPNRRRRRSLARRASRALAVAGLAIALGTQAEAGIISDWIASRTTPTDVTTEGLNPDTDKSLFARWMGRARTPFTSGAIGDSPTLLGQRAWEKTKPVSDAVSESELSAALKLVDTGQLADAERLLKVIATREVKKGSPYGERAQFWLAEVQFRQQKFVKAHDNFEILMKNYQGLDTDHVNQVVKREFQIAQTWLAFEDPKAKQLDWKARFDGRAPMIDTAGYADKVLDHVRINDPRGPLADDAVLRKADHFHLAGDYDQAGVYYDELINDPEHRKSEFREKAMLSSIDSKIKAYSGPEYDVSGLEQASDTIDKMFQEFPDKRAVAEGLYHTQDLIKDQYAERAYTVAMYYLKIRKAASAEYYFGMVIAKWPESKWAGESRKQMEIVAKMPRKASLPSKIMTMPGAPDPSTMGGNGGNNGGAGGAMGGLMNTMGGGMGGMGPN